jgi:hypothetical protein
MPVKTTIPGASAAFGAGALAAARLEGAGAVLAGEVPPVAGSRVGPALLVAREHEIESRHATVAEVLVQAKSRPHAPCIAER